MQVTLSKLPHFWHAGSNVCGMGNFMRVHKALPPLTSRLAATRRARRNSVIVFVLFFGTAAAAVLVALYSELGVPATIVTALLGGGAPAGVYVGLLTYRQGQATQVPTLPEIANLLADAVEGQWQRELTARRLNHPFPLDVTWRPADGILMASWAELVKLASTGVGWPRENSWVSGPDELAGSGSDLASILPHVPTGRLVVLGERGAGKTILMIRLVLDLLVSRVDGPVPVLMPLASWNPNGQGLFDWLATRLAMDFLALGEPTAEADTTRAQALLKARWILPILDGLDELPVRTRREAIAAINDALQLGTPLVITCRTRAYRDAVHARSGVKLHAAAIELRPLAANTVAEYLLADAPGPTAQKRWKPVIDVLGTKGPVAHALSIPLMVSLARTIYNSPAALREQLHPAELLNRRLDSREAAERHLLDAYFAAAYRQTYGVEPRWPAADAKHYLRFLAQHLKDGPSDIAWWNLADAGPRHLVGLTVGLLVAAASGVAYPFIGWAPGIIIGLIVGLSIRMRFRTNHESLTKGFLGGLLGGVIAALLTLTLLGPGTRDYRESGLLATGLTVGVAVGSLKSYLETSVGAFAGTVVGGLYEHAPAFAFARGAVGPWLHLINAIGFGATAFLYVELVGKNKPAQKLRKSPIWVALGISCGIVLGIGVWLQTSWPPGLLTGLFVAAAGILVGGMGETVETELTSPADPLAVLRRDRTAFLISWLGIGIALGIGGGLALAISPNIDGKPNGLLIGVSVGLANVVVIGLTFGFTRAMWGSFTMARLWLCISGRLPWDYMAFLEDAHKRGVLSQAGVVYEFRHVELQERLVMPDSGSSAPAGIPNY